MNVNDRKENRVERIAVKDRKQCDQIGRFFGLWATF